ncbi:hypothetical protein JOM56_003059 [Amanita muscaria]
MILLVPALCIPRAVKSYRLLEETLVLLPPYTALGFDQNIIDISPHQTVTMGQARSLDWICAFGRPLWKASFAVSAGGVYKVLELFQNARTKLLCSTRRFNCNDIDQVFAVLAYTVCLDLVLGNQKAMEFANTTSSEPVLALAAASIVVNLENLPHIIDKLTSTLCVGLVDKGRHGDLLARMVLFLARIQICSPPSPSTPLVFATPVPVVLFLKTLFGELWDETPGHARFEKDLEGGYVNFYHFTLTEEAMPVKEDQNFEANLWTRGTALQCSFRQVDINGHIPVYWGPIDEDAVLDLSKFSSLDYQVRLQTAGDTVSADKIQHPARDPGSSNHPFIATLVGDRGRNATEVDMTGLSPQRQKSKKKAMEALELDPNRYCINARGCDEDVFGVLNTMGIANEWKKLLEITVETPNAEGEIVETMQPLRRLDQTSGYCNWIKDYSASHSQT